MIWHDRAEPVQTWAMRYVMMFLALCTLAACATLDENECRAGNWYEVGKRDGAKGRSADFIFQHAKACNKFGVAPEAAPWRAGRLEGLKLYCRPSAAYRLGTRGLRLAPVCDRDTEVLEDANWRGLRWHEIGREISSVEAEISSINAQLASLPADDPSRTSLISQRSFLRLEILTLRAERGRYRF